MLEMMNVEKLYDEMLFGGERGGNDYGGSPPGGDPADLTRAILQCRAQLTEYCNARYKANGTQPS